MTAVLATVPVDSPVGTGAAPAGRPVSIRPMPRREPPFDDECGRDPHATCVTRVDQHLPFDAPQAGPTLWQAWPPRRSDLPEPAIWARRLLVGMAESAGGRRPLQQLAGFVSPSVQRGIGTQFERAALAGTPHWLQQASVRSVHAAEPAADVVEVCAVLDTGTRVRAAALRLERWRGAWRCTRLQLG